MRGSAIIFSVIKFYVLILFMFLQVHFLFTDEIISNAIQLGKLRTKTSSVFMVCCCYCFAVTPDVTNYNFWFRFRCDLFILNAPHFGLWSARSLRYWFSFEVNINTWDATTYWLIDPLHKCLLVRRKWMHVFSIGMVDSKRVS